MKEDNLLWIIGHFLSCFEPHYESEAKCIAFHMKISFVCI